MNEEADPILVDSKFSVAVSDSFEGDVTRGIGRVWTGCMLAAMLALLIASGIATDVACGANSAARASGSYLVGPSMVANNLAVRTFAGAAASSKATRWASVSSSVSPSVQAVGQTSCLLPEFGLNRFSVDSTPNRLTDCRLLQDPEVVTSDEIARLIKRLGAEGYADRVDARERLLLIGKKALPQLEQSSKLAQVGDFEIQRACLEIALQIRRRTSNSMAKAFLDGAAKLPGWKLFSARVGDTPQHRELYAKIFEEHAERMINLEKAIAGSDPVSPNDPYLAYSTARNPLTGIAISMEVRIAASIFLMRAALENSDPATRPSFAQIQSLMLAFTRSDVVSVMKKSEYRALLLKMMVTLCDALPEESKYDQLQYSLYSFYPSSQFLGAIQSAISNPEVPRVRRAWMIMQLPKIDFDVDPDITPDDVARILESTFDDDESLGPFLVSEADSPTGKEYIAEAKVKDVGLAVSILMERRQPEAFGMSAKALQIPKGKRKPETVDPRFVGFENESARQTAFKKWRDREPLPAQPDPTKQPVSDKPDAGNPGDSP